MFTALFLLAIAPIVAAFDLIKMIVSRRSIPLPQRNLSRATLGAFVLTLVGDHLRSNGFHTDTEIDLAAAGAGAVAAIYLLVGLVGSRSGSRDPISAIWWLAGALICAGLRFGPPDLVARLNLVELHAVTEGWSDMAFFAGMVACGLRFLFDHPAVAEPEFTRSRKNPRHAYRGACVDACRACGPQSARHEATPEIQQIGGRTMDFSALWEEVKDFIAEIEEEYNGRRPIGSRAPDAFYLGRYYNEKTGKVGSPLQLPGNEPIIIVGRNRSGKDAGIGNYNLLRLLGKSVFVLDKGGEGDAVAGPFRGTLGPKYSINAFGTLTDVPGYKDMKSGGLNVLNSLKADSPMLFDHVSAFAEAWNKQEGKDPHWSKRARAMFAGLTMHEVIDAAAKHRPPGFTNVRAIATESDEFDPVSGEPVKGLIATARRLVDSGNPQIASLMGSFTVDNDETRSVRATVDANTLSLLSQPIRDDELKGGLRLSELGEHPTSVFLTMPPDMVKPDGIHSPYLRCVVAAALRSLYRPGCTPCTFYLNEFAALGRLEEVESALGLVAGFGIQLVIVVQSLIQLRQLYEHGWENFLGQAGAVALVGAPADKFTADYLSSRSGETTIRQPNAGMSINQGGVGTSSGEGYMRRKHLLPQDLYALQPGYGYVWVANLDNPIPTYYPPYWDVAAINARARANPYYRG